MWGEVGEGRGGLSSTQSSARRHSERVKRSTHLKTAWNCSLESPGAARQGESTGSTISAPKMGPQLDTRA